MKISENWIRQWVNPNNTSAELGEQLTMLGLELDGMQMIAPPFTGVVVGEVITCEQHPDADKLKVTTINIGADEPLQIVCGASNVRTGLKVAVATVGAELPPIDGKPFTIKKGKLRGVESFGMLCGASELGLFDEIDGLLELESDAPIGMDIREYLGLDDHIFDIAITPNRGDCLSVRGVVRELFALSRPATNHTGDNQVCNQNTALAWANQINDLAKPIAPKGVKVQAPNACPNYLAQPIHDIDRNISSPKWLKDRLIHSGLRTHNFLVDVTNYVLLELGQPLHAFDADKIVGDIVVRLATAGEQLELLNEQTITLTGDELVIADDIGVLALAGIMGGLRSAVTDNTTNIVLESAYFDPLAIASRARRFGLHTDASQRFERGVDYTLAPIALNRAVGLIVSTAGGTLGEPTCIQSPDHLPVRQTIYTPLAKIKSLLGVNIDTQEIINILNALEIHTTQDGDVLVCTPPSHRFDLTISEDIVEEVARIYGYDNIHPVLPNFGVDMRYDDSQDILLTLKQTLVAQGYFEAVSFSFSDEKLETLLNDDKLGAVLPLANPISSDLAVMRRTLLSSLIPIVQYNLNRKQNHLRFFETGLSFVGKDINELVQTPSLAMIATATFADSMYDTPAMDFFDLKGEIESLLPANIPHHAICYERADLAFLHTGQSAYLVVDGQKIGWFGQLHPSIAKTLELGTIWVAQLNLELLLQLHRQKSTIDAPSKFPSVHRDLAFLVDKDISWQTIADDIQASIKHHLTDLVLFDVYQGDKLPTDKKSFAFSMTLQNPNNTLDDDTIKALMQNVIHTLSTKHNAQLRDS